MSAWPPEKWKTVLGTLAHLGLNSLIFSVFLFFSQGKPALSREDFDAVFDYYDTVWRRLLIYMCVCWGAGGGGRVSQRELLKISYK